MEFREPFHSFFRRLWLLDGMIAIWQLDSVCLRRAREVESLSKPTPRLVEGFETDRKRDNTETALHPVASFLATTHYVTSAAHRRCSQFRNGGTPYCARIGGCFKGTQSDCRSSRGPLRACRCFTKEALIQIPKAPRARIRPFNGSQPHTPGAWSWCSLNSWSQGHDTSAVTAVVKPT